MNHETTEFRFEIVMFCYNFSMFSAIFHFLTFLVQSEHGTFERIAIIFCTINEAGTVLRITAKIAVAGIQRLSKTDSRIRNSQVFIPVLLSQIVFK